MINDKLNLKPPCPLCGTQPEITLAVESTYDNRIIIECLRCGLQLDHTQCYYTTEKYDEKNNMLTIERTGMVDSESAIDIWNRRTPELGNETTQLWDAMFPKCKNCPSCPSDYSNIVCICSECMYLPKHPQGDHFEFQFGPYGGEE